ncbi:hypothetical protein [Actinoplanes sp. G11-F43]|uniref:hypothetical protein n=1 Tax=Actinoplanes sp. G11-F43 TaxID=3424130 RepID=UPI003D32AA50
MSGLTLQDLLGFDAGPWHTASQVWHQLALGLDDTSDGLINGTRDISEIWPRGTGSVAAREKANTLRTAVSDAYPPAKRLADAFDQHAYAMKGLRGQAESVIASAQQSGYTVDTAAVTITAPASAYLGGNLDRTGRETGELLGQLRSVVDSARAQDDATAAIINSNVPTSAAGLAAARPAGHSRAEELAKRLRDPNHQATPEELSELSTLLKEYGQDKDFSHHFLTTLGPKGLLELNGQLALHQLDRPGKDEDGWLFDRGTADTIGDLQRSLGIMLDNATEPTGTRTGPRGEVYVPGQYELSSQWISDLMTAGRSQMDIGDPYSPGRRLENVYGYQLLGPLLRTGDYDAGFLSTVGGDMVDFEMEKGKDGALWTEARGENVRLDWTQDHDNNTAPAGYDPVSSLMDALSRNGDATRDLLTGTTTFSADGPADGRLPRLDYLLTDRDWTATVDVPGGPGWTAELMTNGDAYQTNPALDRFGEALVQATTNQDGPESRRLVESIIHETNADEQAQGRANRDHSEPGKAGTTTDLRSTDFIHPQLRDSMGQIVAAYIYDVNLNLTDGHPVNDTRSIDVDQADMVRFLADVGKDQGAYHTIAAAEATYAATNYLDIASGNRTPGATLDQNIAGMEVVSNNYGRVMGALDLGLTEAQKAEIAAIDEAHNKKVEGTFRIAGPLVEAVVGAATDRIPVPGAGDLANGFIGNVMEDIEKAQQADHQGVGAFNAGSMLSGGRETAVGIAEMALYKSGELDLPAQLLVDGQPKPTTDWGRPETNAWNDWRDLAGTNTVGKAATAAGNYYQNGYDSAAGIVQGKSPS